MAEPDDRGTRGCAICHRLRWFLGLALPLVVLVGWRPDWAVMLATRIPDPMSIAIAINLAGAVGLAWRLRARR